MPFTQQRIASGDIATVDMGKYTVAAQQIVSEGTDLPRSYEGLLRRPLCSYSGLLRRLQTKPTMFGLVEGLATSNALL